MSIEIKTAVTEDFSMQYFCFGKGEKNFVILPGLSIQSVMGASGIIAEAYDILSEDFTVYVFDRRSELPEAYSVYSMARDTAKVFKKLGLSDIYLFGASQGGMIALEIAAAHPELVKKLMLGSSAAKIDSEQIKAIDGWIKLAEKKDGVKLNLTVSKDIYPESIYKQFEETFRKIGESISESDLQRFITLANGTKGFDVTDKIGSIACPVLSLGASDDRVLPDSAKQIEKLFEGRENFESFTYTGFGHAAFDTAPDYKQRLLEFCNK